MTAEAKAAQRLDNLPCASPGCTSLRHYEGRRRRWCRIHCLVRDIEIEGAGGGTILFLKEYR